jgi:hypothetical protein
LAILRLLHFGLVFYQTVSRLHALISCFFSLYLRNLSVSVMFVQVSCLPWQALGMLAWQ